MLKRVLILSMCFGVALLVVTLAGALVWKTRIGQRTFYTDGQTISMQAAHARPREVMWSPQVALPGSINSDFSEFDPQVSEDGLTLLLVRRDAAGDVHFSELSPLVFRLLQLLEEDAMANGSDALRQLATEANAVDVDAFIRDGVAMLAQLQCEGVVLGTAD